MKRIIQSVITGVFCLAILLGIPARSLAKIDPDQVDLKMDISKLGVAELRLYRNAIYARHCYFFQDVLLRAEFGDFEERKCGEKMYFREPEKAFDDSKLSPAEKKFVERIYKREIELKAKQVQITDQGPVYNRQAVVNTSQFSTLPDPVMDRLFKSGFVVLPAKHEQLFQVYEDNDYRMIPNFITADSVLQLYHLYFDFTLRQIEENKLFPAAVSLCQGMTQKLLARYQATKDERLREAFRRAVLYFAVAEDLTKANPPQDFQGDSDEIMSIDEETGEITIAKQMSPEDAGPLPPLPAWMEENWKKDFLLQRELILNAEKNMVKGPIMGTVDYTMFKPRGHYTRTPTLKKYFRTLMWLGLPGFILDEEVMPIEVPLIIVYELIHDPKLLLKYNLIYEPTSFYVGPTDDITPELVKKVADEICGPNATFEQWIAKKEAIRQELKKRNPTRIQTKFYDDRDLPQVRFMGMRYIPDSEILQRLSDPDFRAIPMGLDIFGVMGVPAALEILKQAKIEWPDYWPEMEKLQAEFKDLKPQSGEMNLYWRWIRLLKTLNQPAPQGAAQFMRTKPWEYKNLNTALASWAELRHDTILYAKQSGGAECGAEVEILPRVVGYVEARPDFFQEMLELQRYTTAELERQKLLTPRLEKVGEQMAEMFVFLERVSRKEVKGERLTEEEYTGIRVFGSQLEYLTISILTDSNEWSQVQGPDRFIAVVADVHSTSITAKALEEAVGYAEEIFALVEIEGYLYITRGSVFSYYEFLQPVSNRLTDEEWQSMLRRGQAPDRPSWCEKFMVDQPAVNLPIIYYYSSGC